jgi:hypothetical protein
VTSLKFTVHKTNNQTQQTVPQFPISQGEEEKEEKKVQSQSRTIRIVTDVAVLGGNRVSQYRCRASEALHCPQLYIGMFPHLLAVILMYRCTVQCIDENKSGQIIQ